MSFYAIVNADAEARVERLCITRRDTDNDDGVDDDDVIEDIEDPKYESDEYAIAYPPHPLFVNSYRRYLEHVACSWTVNENDPTVDYDKFAQAPEEFQRIVLRTAACIMIGDSVVLDKLRIHVTPVNVRMMLVSQEDRENTHQLVYSRWCDVSPDGAAYRGVEFRRRYMGRFDELAKRYESSDVRLAVFFIMLCENVMFAPMFQILCYLATTGYAPKICNSNLLVMRDERIHYMHARELMAGFKRKLSFELARRILDEFCDVTLRLARDIVGDYDDGRLNYAHVEAHFRHVVYAFMAENELFRDAEEERAAETAYGTTPAHDYVTLPSTEIKINLMESTSTIYRAPGVPDQVDMSFDP